MIKTSKIKIRLFELNTGIILLNNMSLWLFVRVIISLIVNHNCVETKIISFPSYLVSGHSFVTREHSSKEQTITKRLEQPNVSLFWTKMHF